MHTGNAALASKQDIIDGFGEPSTAVYVMVAGSACKIGISTNPGNRARLIQTGQEKLVCIFWAVRLGRSSALKIEADVHKVLRRGKDHASGEWYYISPAFARQEIEKAIQKRGFKWRVDVSFGWDRG